MILCDTNILIEFYKDNAGVKDAMRRIGVSNLSISVITAGELYYGARNRRELKEIQQHLALLEQIPLSAEISERFLRLIAEFALSHRLSVPDALIAATAIEHGIPLYTLNLKDFRYIPMLEIHTP